VEVLHEAEPLKVTVRYRTEGEFAAVPAPGTTADTKSGTGTGGQPVALTVKTLDGGTVLRELPPAPAGAEVTIELPLAGPAYAPAEAGAATRLAEQPVTGLLLQPAAGGTSHKVYVEQLRFAP
jgi:hypothetical protein